MEGEKRNFSFRLRRKCLSLSGLGTYHGGSLPKFRIRHDSFQSSGHRSKTHSLEVPLGFKGAAHPGEVGGVSKLIRVPVATCELEKLAKSDGGIGACFLPRVGWDNAWLV